MQGKMLVARGEGANTSSKDEESNGLNAVEQPMLERPASVDPLQPNITYREPDVGGYHSRCSSARDYIFGTNEPAQAKIPRSVTPRKLHSTKMIQSARRERRTNKSALDQMTHFSAKQSRGTQATQLNIPPKTYQDLERPVSQRNRMEQECNAMDETKALKRRAQIVPHRIDLPFYMSGLSAPLGERYQLIDKDIEKLRLMASGDGEKRNISANKRNDSTRLRTNSPVGVKPSGGRRRENSKDESRKWNSKFVADGLRSQGIESKKETAKAVTNEHEGKIDLKTEKEKEKEEYLMQYKGGKRITVGGFASPAAAKDPFQLDLLERELSGGNTDALHILSKKQKRAFEAIFNDIDFDSNGKVSFDELVHRLFSNVSKRDARLLMQIFDVDRNKFIDRREFITICALNDRLCGFWTESKYDCLRLDLENLSKHLSMYRNLFDMLDHDGDEKIHVDEVMLIMSTGMGKEIGMNENVVQSVMDNIDRDKNGYIDFIGFVMYIPFFLRLHNSMMNSKDLKLREIQETKDDIHEQLRSRINSPSV